MNIYGKIIRKNKGIVKKKIQDSSFFWQCESRWVMGLERAHRWMQRHCGNILLFKVLGNYPVFYITDVL